MRPVCLDLSPPWFHRRKTLRAFFWQRYNICCTSPANDIMPWVSFRGSCHYFLLLTHINHKNSSQKGKTWRGEDIYRRNNLVNGWVRCPVCWTVFSPKSQIFLHCILGCDPLSAWQLAQFECLGGLNTQSRWQTCHGNFKIKAYHKYN